MIKKYNQGKIELIEPMKAKNISELEHHVMNIVWAVKDCTVRDVYSTIVKNRPIAYTTTLTILQRLYDKGLVLKKKDGKAFRYRAKISKEAYSKSMAQGFLKKFITSFGDVGIASFAESIENLSKKERAYLLDLLDHHEKNT